MKIILLALVLLIIVSCKKANERNLLTIETFELGSCFSVISLSNSEVVISNNESYLEFQDSIRRHFNSSCDSVTLTEIDFTESFFIGKFSQTSGCSAEYKRSVYYSVENDSYDYEIEVTKIGDCEMLIASFNCTVVPKQSKKEKVNVITKIN